MKILNYESILGQIHSALCHKQEEMYTNTNKRNKILVKTKQGKCSSSEKEKKTEFCYSFVINKRYFFLFIQSYSVLFSENFKS